MISRILYRETVHGVLNYVFGKEGSIILGYQNTISEFNTPTKFFTNVLHFQGQRHDTARRYAHITLNLPHGEHLNDETFYEVAKDYMEEMGYGRQPYVVVRHSDTIHEHIHLVSTTVNESGTLINLRNDFRRNVATQRFLEKKYGLSPSPATKRQRDLPRYRLPEYQLSVDEKNGTKFYIQDVINGLLQKYKVRCFEELARLAKPYHIVVRTMTHKSGRVGVAYGIDNQKQYNTQFINGYVVHPKLSGPKLRSLFGNNRRSKLLPMHKKRLEKQLSTTFQLFGSIRYEDLPDVLKSYQNIDCQLVHGKNGHVPDFTVYDKSGYVFESSEIGPKHRFNNYPQLGTDPSDETLVNIEGNQFKLEIKKLINRGFYESYLNSDKSELLFSEYVANQSFKDMLPIMARSEWYSFLSHYLPKDTKKIVGAIRNEFKGTQIDLVKASSAKEIQRLQSRTGLIQKVLENSVFDTSENKCIPFYLLQGLGLKYQRGKISYLNSNKHYCNLSLDKIQRPISDRSYISTGSIGQNEKVLEMLTAPNDIKKYGLGPTAFFLPLLMPELYGSMKSNFLSKFEKQSLRAYYKSEEQSNAAYEKSPRDYVELFNAKGFFFERKKGKIHIASIYSKSSVSMVLTNTTQEYLESIKDLDALLESQNKIIEPIRKQGQGHLKNLWASYLMEKQCYDKVAFMMVHENVRPNLPPEAMEYHMENGLRTKLYGATKQKVGIQQALLLRKSVFAFSSLMGAVDKKEEVFNGFKDELTDYSKYKSLFI